MEDTSIIKPILDALEYFNNSAEEINYFYKIIDKFCSCWFNKQVNPEKFTNIELFLIHDLLGEFIRFEENNKRVALWLLSINRVCNNYSTDLSSTHEELLKINDAKDQDIDSTLIEPILNEVVGLEKLHAEAGKNDMGEKDIISYYLQWVMVYSIYIYPSLGNKLDFNDKIIINAMNFILTEFIKQRSNAKRMAYLVMGIKEACKLYSLQNQEISKECIDTYSNADIIFPGKDEDIVKEILEKLNDGNIKQRENEQFFNKITADQFVENTYEKLIVDLNFYSNKSISIFNKYIFDLTNKFTSFNKNDKYSFLKTLYNFELKNIKINKKTIIESLKKSIDLFPDKQKKWINSEILKLNTKKENYIEEIIKITDLKDTSLVFKTNKLYILIFLINKLKLIGIIQDKK